MNFLLELLQIVFGCFTSLLLFQSGFLLSKPALEERSKCSDVITIGDQCWSQAQFNRTIWLIIDGLRFDFIEPLNDGLVLSEAEQLFRNRMPRTARLLNDSSERARLFRFLADAPTTTFQRLKALTTGGIPAFIEAGKNFGGEQVLDDNLIEQLNAAGRNVTLIGDDTWTRLFPHGFTRLFALPSFDIKDLDTVDNMVIGHIEEEVKHGDWTLLLAHCLGIDHSGHRYGISHREMSRKLEQMDQLIANITQWMTEDTLMVVMGDHGLRIRGCSRGGLTLTGDHGGDSRDEVESGLFVFTKRDGFFPPRGAGTTTTVNQVDIVPTVSLLLDLPIPFSNIGVRVEEMMPEHLLVQATKVNTAQVLRYAQRYADKVGGGDIEFQLRLLIRNFNRANSDDDLDLNRETMQRLQSLFRSFANQIDESLALIGIVSLVDIMLYIVCRLMAVGEEGGTGLPMLVFRSALMLLQLSIYFAAPSAAKGRSAGASLGGDASMLLTLALVSSLGYQLIHAVVNGFHYLATHSFKNSPPGTNTTPSAALVILSAAAFHSLSFLSNSYILYEADVALFLLQGTTLVSLLAELGTTRLVKRGIVGNLRGNASWRRVLARHITCMIALRAGKFFESCREEQVECVPASVWSNKRIGGSEGEARAGAMESARSSRAVTATGLSIVTLSLLSYYLYSWLPRQSARHERRSVSSNVSRLLTWTMVLAVMVHWLCDLMESTVTGSQTPHQTLFETGARRSALLVYLIFLLHLGCDLLGMFTSADGGRIALQKRLTRLIPVPLLMILLGRFTAPALALIYIALELAQSDDENDSGWLQYTLYASTLCSYSFYALGHQAVFTAIPWEAAFVGVPGNFSVQALPALLILTNLYAGHLFVVCQLFSASHTASTVQQPTRNGNNSTAKKKSTILLFLLLTLAKAVGCCLAGFIHRRHLMFFKVFATKFVFEAVALLFVYVAVIGLCLLIRPIFPSAELRQSHMT